MPRRSANPFIGPPGDPFPPFRLLSFLSAAPPFPFPASKRGCRKERKRRRSCVQTNKGGWSRNGNHPPSRRRVLCGVARDVPRGVQGSLTPRRKGATSSAFLPSVVVVFAAWREDVGRGSTQHSLCNPFRVDGHFLASNPGSLRTPGYYC
jgi:hypothetical protein